VGIPQYFVQTPAMKKANMDLEDEKDHCSVPYFRTKLAEETRRLTDLCDSWEKKLEINKEVISDVTEGELRCVIGQGRLVMAERFNQFSGLVDNCEFKQGEKETTCMDLKGFWEMIYFQVEDVDKKFSKLERMENNNWVDDQEEAILDEKCTKTRKNSVGVAKKRAAVVVKKVASAGLKALIAAKRRKASASVGGDVDNKPCEDDDKENSNDVDSMNIIIDKASEDSSYLISPEKTFDGGFFSVKSPVRQVMKSPRTSRSTGCDKLRKSVMTGSAKRVSGLISPYVSQIAKRAVATDSLSPVRRSSLFDEDFDQEEEVENEVIDQSNLLNSGDVF